jgi:hypothetical protein
MNRSERPSPIIIVMKAVISMTMFHKEIGADITYGDIIPGATAPAMVIGTLLELEEIEPTGSFQLRVKFNPAINLGNLIKNILSKTGIEVYIESLKSSDCSALEQKLKIL